MFRVRENGSQNQRVPGETGEGEVQDGDDEHQPHRALHGNPEIIIRGPEKYSLRIYF